MKVKKINLFLTVFLGMLAVGFIFSIARAEESDRTPMEKRDYAPAKPETKRQQDAQAEKLKEANKASNKKVDKNKASFSSHQSAVAVFVQNLLSVADRESGIGEEVRIIAREQNESAEKILNEIKAVETRSKIKTFFIGSDYKNLGDLRSDMVKTDNQIEKLKRLAEKAENADNRSILNSQIESFSIEQAKIRTFITDNENRFSLFGWVVKLLQK